MTLKYEPELDIAKLYRYTKNELSRSMLSKIMELQTDRQTDRHASDCKQYHAMSWLITMQIVGAGAPANCLINSSALPVNR